jgi:hypothetical protein
MRQIAQLPFNAVVVSEWRYASTFHLCNYIFVEGSCFPETNIRLVGVASFELTYFNFIQFNLLNLIKVTVTYSSLTPFNQI